MRASKRRLWLAVYLDYLLFAPLFAIFRWLLGPTGIDLSWAVDLLAFVLIEGALVRGVDFSPGRRALGIVRAEDGSIVLPFVRARERWWTMLLGVCGVMEGAKEIARFTQGLPPPPFMNLDLTWDVRAALLTTSGLIYLSAGLSILRTRTLGAWVGLALHLVSSLSVLVSWAHMPAWVEARLRAQDALRGRVTTEERLATMQTMLPTGMVISAIVGTLWLALVLVHFRRAAPRDRDGV